MKKATVFILLIPIAILLPKCLPLGNTSHKQSFEKKVNTLLQGDKLYLKKGVGNGYAHLVQDSLLVLNLDVSIKGNKEVERIAQVTRVVASVYEFLPPSAKSKESVFVSRVLLGNPVAIYYKNIRGAIALRKYNSNTQTQAINLSLVISVNKETVGKLKLLSLLFSSKKQKL